MDYLRILVCFTKDGGDPNDDNVPGGLGPGISAAISVTIILLVLTLTTIIIVIIIIVAIKKRKGYLLKYSITNLCLYLVIYLVLYM